MIEGVISFGLSFLQAVLLFAVLYYYGLLIASIPKPRLSNSISNSEKIHRFAILIPAHNEEEIIGLTVRKILELDYPRDHFKIYVVADHCQDRTAEMACLAGAECLERTVEPKGRKGYALAWLLEQKELFWCNISVV